MAKSKNKWEHVAKQSNGFEYLWRGTNANEDWCEDLSSY